MSEHGAPETIAAHMVLSESAAEVWRRVAHGELTLEAGVARVIEARADPGGVERAELERAGQVFAPPTAERREELLEALLKRHRGQEREAVVSLAERAKTKGASASKGWIVGLLAAAAVLVLWGLPGAPPPEPPEPQQHALAAGYELELAGMSREVRGGPDPEPQPDELPRFDVDGKIRVDLVPDDDVEGSITVVVFALQGTKAVRLEVEPRVHPSGTVDIDMPVRALGLSEGEWELVFAVGRSGAVPSTWEEISVGAPGYELVRTRVEIVSTRKRG